jgi:small subunit ribosomal protein S16
LLRIRLSRVGKKKQPSYRIVVTDQRNARDSEHLEILGHYNPLTNPATLVMNEDRAVHWLQVGARPSDTAAKILTKQGVMEKAGKEPVTWGGKQSAPGAKKRKAMEAAASAAPATAPAAAAPAASAALEAPAVETPTPEGAPGPVEPAEEAAATPEATAEATE